jgi:hypothetical protein
MENWALFVSFIAMVLIAASYFMKGKSGFFLYQVLGMIFLMTSYLLTQDYFPMIGLGIGMGRSVTYFVFEKKEKNPSIFWPILFSSLSVMAYLIINVIILQTAKSTAIIYLMGLVLYAFIYWIRDLQKMRYLATIPTALSILYNVVSKAPVFTVISYTFELCANIAAIYKYNVKPKMIIKNKIKRK